MNKADRPDDRRQARRRFYKTQAMCHRGRDGLSELVTGQILDLSAGGARVLVRGEFADDEFLYLALVNPRRDTVAEISARVCRREQEGPGVMRIGVAFERPLTNDEFDAVV